MKKLLFASIIMMGFSAVAAAQTSDALKAKKAEARKQAGQPSFSTAAGDATAKPSTVAADKAKSEKEAAAEKTAVAEPQAAAVKKAEKPVERRVNKN